ncbi:hypothetical protein SELMODRAFT_403167 [Selaginella moellendorffii]|uniref:Uncharacterized protein n=1 Tax=Selaginella moellendorffii TaxID=88036 RepID=D8QTB2_SELML|nr:hypothetical protein SELMODRAFT_403167 [Selaginella moellendorffii]
MPLSTDQSRDDAIVTGREEKFPCAGDTVPTGGQQTVAFRFVTSLYSYSLFMNDCQIQADMDGYMGGRHWQASVSLQIFGTTVDQPLGPASIYLYPVSTQTSGGTRLQPKKSSPHSEFKTKVRSIESVYVYVCEKSLVESVSSCLVK